MNKLPKELQILYQYYNEEDWHRYISCFPEVDYENDNHRYIPEDIYRVVSWNIGDIEKWFNTSVSALKNHKPKHLLEHYIYGDIAIKIILMRIP